MFQVLELVGMVMLIDSLKKRAPKGIFCITGGFGGMETHSEAIVVE